MTKEIKIVALGLAVAGVIAWYVGRGPALDSERLFEAESHPPEAAPLCPWRSPEQDRARFFPEANGCQTEVRILSSQRLELQKKLGRWPAPDEHALHLNRILDVLSEHQPAWLGTILTRRVKGEFGAMEIVVAADRTGRLRGVRLQRAREPEPIIAALESPAWLDAFKGKSWADDWVLGRGLPSVPPEAVSSAQALVDGVRSCLVLLSSVDEPKPAGARPHH